MAKIHLVDMGAKNQVAGSLVNHMLSGTNGQPVPEVGMGATLLYWTDRYAATITFVSENKRTIHIQRDHADRTDDRGMSEAQAYKFARNTGAAVEVFTLRKNGAYVRAGDSIKGLRLRIGERNHYHDYSF